ncbi:DNaJ domain (Prokaryotic heat shock protein) [Dirofilaria immitis]|nr:DNaJ domain (Prokaryotic heat shock protein) [Dirofilaria immitis]
MSDASSLSSIYENEEGANNQDDEDLDFYAILNVPRDATLDEINRSYRQKCLIFHPDRHPLTDPKLRTIYDTVGLQGLELHGWELIPKSDNAENIRREYEFLKRLRETEIMLQRVHPSGLFSCKTSLTGIFAANPELRCPPQVTGLSISQNIECAMTAKDKVGLSGRVKMNNGKGDGSFALHWKMMISSSCLFELTTTFTPDSIMIGCKYAKSMYLKNAIVIQPSVQYFPLYSAINPGCTFILSRNLHPCWQGSIIYHCGFQPYLTTSLIHTEFNMPKFLINLTISPSNSNVRMVYTRRSIGQDSFTEFSCIFSLMGIMPAVAFERRLSRYSRIGCDVLFAFLLVFYKLNLGELKTGASVYDYQFLLCDSEEDLARSTLYGVIMPIAAFYLLKGIFRHTYERFMSLFEDHSEERQIDAVKREEASNIIDLMRRTAERIAKEEEQKHGLIIVEAKYGQMVGEGPNALSYPLLGNHIVDVTVPLQAMVNDSQLRIYSGKSQLPGFYDPCPTESKMLRVIYKYKDQIHSVSVPDEVALHIPMISHWARCCTGNFAVIGR